ncbi:mRNA decay activator protein ZFP36L1-like protein [Cinnamomum micranthum f. kanehirae]|uniref:mRNA decay activator protein ZFP36L1-like protein n=1 Tax=Cinnamomum micranthum f. kanehirae TaxID=337451 RepID=A0A3S3NPY4_9MAGN|nr:mRNA decay activator protein ZFP36L1-like protein [Cinnamomum micranthum f. kanehirae]
MKGSSNEPIPFLSPISFDFLDEDDDRYRYKEERHITGMCYNNGRNSNSLSNNSFPLIDSTNNQRPRYPTPPANAFLGLGGPLLSPLAVDLGPTIPRYPPPPSAAAEAFLSVAETDLLNSRRRAMRSLSSSRGSSPSPLSPIENLETPPSRSPPGFKRTTPTQGKVSREEVLVMDGILVDACVNRTVTRPPLDSSANILYKTEICNSWVDTGFCRYGSKCQYAHGKEELRPSRPRKFKPESPRGSKAHQDGETTETVEASPAKTATESEEMVAAAIGGSITDAEAYINKVLYGPSQRRRLPVFEEICPSDN